MAYSMAHPMAYRWSILTLGSALLQSCVNNVLRQSVRSTTLFRRQTLGRLESGKRECGTNTTFGELSYETAIIIEH